MGMSEKLYLIYTITNVCSLHGHGQVSEKLYATIKSTCSADELQYGDLSSKCEGIHSLCTHYTLTMHLLGTAVCTC
jgi:hypothetical protein